MRLDQIKECRKSLSDNKQLEIIEILFQFTLLEKETFKIENSLLILKKSTWKAIEDELLRNDDFYFESLKQKSKVTSDVIAILDRIEEECHPNIINLSFKEHIVSLIDYYKIIVADLQKKLNYYSNKIILDNNESYYQLKESLNKIIENILLEVNCLKLSLNA